MNGEPTPRRGVRTMPEFASNRPHWLSPLDDYLSLLIIPELQTFRRCGLAFSPPLFLRCTHQKKNTTNEISLDIFYRNPNEHHKQEPTLAASRERNRFKSILWDEYDSTHQKYLEISKFSPNQGTHDQVGRTHAVFSCTEGLLISELHSKLFDVRLKTQRRGFVRVRRVRCSLTAIILAQVNIIRGTKALIRCVAGKIFFLFAGWFLFEASDCFIGRCRRQCGTIKFDKSLIRFLNGVYKIFNMWISRQCGDFAGFILQSTVFNVRHCSEILSFEIPRQFE